MATEIENHQENKELKTKKKKKKQSLGGEDKVEETHDVPELKNGDEELAENGSEIQSPTDGKKKKKKKKKDLASIEPEDNNAQTEDAHEEVAEVQESGDANEGETKKKKKKKGKKKESMSTESENVEEETVGQQKDDPDTSVADKADEQVEDSGSEHEEKSVKKGKKRAAEESHAVYIGNMSFNTSEDQLTEFFTSSGHKPVSAVIISWQSGHSSGFGIVYFASKEEAESAIELDGGTLDGRNVRINVYTGKLQKTSGGFQKGRSPGGSGGHAGEESDTLFAVGLSYNTSEDDIYEAFQGCESVDIFKDRETGNSKGLAKIKFGSVEEAKTALSEMNNEELDGRTIKLRFFSPQGGGGRGGRGGRGGFRGGRGGDRGRGFGRGRGRGRGGGTPFKGSGQKIKFDD